MGMGGTQPKWPNQVGSLHFWWSVYSSSTSFFLVCRYYNQMVYAQLHAQFIVNLLKKYVAINLSINTR